MSGEKLKYYRTICEYSRTDIAELLEVDEKHVRRWETEVRLIQDDISRRLYELFAFSLWSQCMSLCIRLLEVVYLPEDSRKFRTKLALAIERLAVKKRFFGE